MSDPINLNHYLFVILVHIVSTRSSKTLQICREGSTYFDLCNAILWRYVYFNIGHVWVKLIMRLLQNFMVLLWRGRAFRDATFWCKQLLKFLISNYLIFLVSFISLTIIRQNLWLDKVIIMHLIVISLQIIIEDHRKSYLFTNQTKTWQLLDFSYITPLRWRMPQNLGYVGYGL